MPNAARHRGVAGKCRAVWAQAGWMAWSSAATIRCFSSKVWFALDSPLAGAGLELSVPLKPNLRVDAQLQACRLASASCRIPPSAGWWAKTKHGRPYHSRQGVKTDHSVYRFGVEPAIW